VTSTQSRSVVVTGASRGIGLEIARKFQADGDRVVDTYRTTAPDEKFILVPCDVTSRPRLHRGRESTRPCQVLVANAGITDDRLLLRMPRESFTSVLDTNLTGSFSVAQRAIKGMMRARSGRIIFISSAVALRGQSGQRERLLQQIPVGLLAQPQEIADVVHRRGQGYINGEIIYVDGGAAMGH